MMRLKHESYRRITKNAHFGMNYENLGKNQMGIKSLDFFVKR